MEVDGVERTFVTGGEVVHLEIFGHDLGLAEETGLNQFVILEFLFAADGVVAGVELVGEGSGGLLGLILGGGHGCHFGVERINIGGELLDMDVCLFEFAAELSDGAFLIGNLLFKGGD